MADGLPGPSAEQLAAEATALRARIAATDEVLRAIAAEPADPRPVFDLIVRHARELAGAATASLLEYDGTLLHRRADAGWPPDLLVELHALYPRPPGPGFVPGRVVLADDVVQIEDVAADPDAIAPARALGARTYLGVPLRREGRIIGVLTMSRADTGAFDEQVVSLVHSFAEQAVIALHQARLMAEQREALARQTATAEVLQVINASPGVLAPVFAAILDKAHMLCGAAVGALFLAEEGLFRAVATKGYLAEVEATLRQARPPGGRMRGLLDGGRFQQSVDIREDAVPGGLDAVVAGFGVRTSLIVPLREDGRLVGWITANRLEVRPYAEAEIALLESFAAQAVIAIRNARLLGELREALDYQSATSGLLRTVSSALGELDPVFEEILERAHVLCGAEQGSLQLWDGERMRAVAVRGQPEDVVAVQRAGYAPHPTDRLDGVDHIHDVREALAAGRGGATLRLVAERTGLRTLLRVPLLKDGRVLGRIISGRREVRPFEAKHIALLQTFADQAVLAIENSRLLDDLRARTAELAARNDAYGEQVVHQSATIDVLKAMSASPADPQPIFALIAQRAREICEGDSVTVFQYDGSMVHLRHVEDPATGDDASALGIRRAYPMAPSRATTSGLAILDRRILHMPDMQAEQDLLPALKARGHRSHLAVPLLRGETAVGAIMLNARRPGGFSDRQVELMKTFAEQAVIAIDSAATFAALQQRTEELARSVRDLQALEETSRAVNASLDLDTVLATIITRSVRLSAADEGTLYEYDEAEGVFVPRAAEGMAEARIAALRERRVRLWETHLGRAAAMGQVVHVADIQQDPELGVDARGILAGIHAVLALPLLREGRVLGGLVIRRRRAGAFDPPWSACCRPSRRRACWR